MQLDKFKCKGTHGFEPLLRKENITVLVCKNVDSHLSTWNLVLNLGKAISIVGSKTPFLIILVSR